MQKEMLKLTDALDAKEDGPAKEGIQNQPSVNKPSSATLDNALQRSPQHQVTPTPSVSSVVEARGVQEDTPT